MVIEIIVPGAPVGKARPRVTKSGHAYTPEKTRAYEQKVKLCWKQQSGERFPPGAGICVEITAYMPIPSSLSMRKQEALLGKEHLKKPDLDNIIKAILDALNGCAYGDDSVIWMITASKYYGRVPQVRIRLTGETD